MPYHTRDATLQPFGIQYRQCQGVTSNVWQFNAKRRLGGSNVINAFCRQLFRENHPARSKRHCFFHCSSKYQNEKRKKVMKDLVLYSFDGAGSAKPLHLTDLLCFPSLWQSHWFLFVVDVMDEKFIFLDSLLSANSD
ncbi:hypothetical protein BRADI_3g38176v3 [Brachypodium distachyon]|uniref:Ubiquitin-like protease family profile domain-containing protein n=1 Tax=Brachypodium distachyon TaxID=15368 RepID=A0A2K2D1Y2_BRADI|nr:hypothetical protein BRADI_3g38176v3 [Brachypodium distachyon]